MSSLSGTSRVWRTSSHRVPASIQQVHVCSHIRFVSVFAMFVLQVLMHNIFPIIPQVMMNDLPFMTKVHVKSPHTASAAVSIMMPHNRRRST